MPREMQDPDAGGPDDSGWSRKFDDGPSRPWWRPASTWGRVFLGLGVLVVLSGIFASAFILKTFLERDSRFRIAGTSNIQANGLAEVSRSEMLPVFGEDVGRNIFFVPLVERRKQLEQIPWVERATVMRLLPDQIRVSVVERKPVAFVRHDQQIGLVDADGVLLTMPASMMAQHHYSFPVVTGIDSRDALPSRKARMMVYQRLLAELDANGQHLSDQVSEIDLTDPEDARVLMPEQGADIMAHFGEDQFLERYQRYKAHIAEWRQQYPKLAEVDLRYDQQVVLQMTPGAKTASTAVSAGDGKPTPANAEKTAQEKPSAQKLQDKPETAKADPPKHAASSKPSKTHAGAKSSKAARNKANKNNKKKKRAEASRAALNVNRQKSAAKPYPAAVSGQGQ